MCRKTGFRLPVGETFPSSQLRPPASSARPRPAKGLLDIQWPQGEDGLTLPATAKDAHGALPQCPHILTVWCFQHREISHYPFFAQSTFNERVNVFLTCPPPVSPPKLLGRYSRLL